MNLAKQRKKIRAILKQLKEPNGMNRFKATRKGEIKMSMNKKRAQRGGNRAGQKTKYPIKLYHDLRTK